MHTIITTVNHRNILHSYLFIKDNLHHTDTIIFLYEEDAKPYIDNLILLLNSNSVDDPNRLNFHSFCIFSHALADTSEIIKNHIFKILRQNPGKPILLNLTCKNEILSLTLFDHLKDLPNLSAFSVVPSKNIYIAVAPNHIYNQTREFKTNLKLDEFFNIFGFEIISSDNNYNTPQNCPSPEARLKDYLNTKQTDHNIINQNNKFTSEQKEYLTGRWLELLIYNTFKKKGNISKKRLSMNIKFKNSLINYQTRRLNDSNDYELDVAVVHKNTLHIIECKTFFEHQKLFDAMFKISSIQKLFPENVKSHIFSLTRFDSQVGNLEKEILMRKKDILNIESIATLNVVSKNQKLTEFIENILS